MENQKGKIVILGDFLHEGIEAAITTRGYNFEKMSLYGVKPKTWLKRVSVLDELIEADLLSAIIVYLPTPVLLHGCKSDFEVAWNELLKRLELTKSLVFIYEDNMSGEFYYLDNSTGQRYTLKEAEKLLDSKMTSEDDEVAIEYEHHPLRFAVENMHEAEEHNQEIESLLEKLFESKIEISPFRSRADVTVRIQDFLTEFDEGIFLRLYVPNNRLQSEQIESFLKSFERYLNQIEGKSFSVDSHKTKNGVLYILRSKDETSSIKELENAVKRFDTFMRLCRDNPSDAISVLQNSGFDSAQSNFLATKYAKEYQRILMDAKHELEHKLILLRQRIESDTFERISGNKRPLIDDSNPSVMLSFVGNTGPINLSLNDIVATTDKSINKEVNQIFNGGITYNENDEKLLQLIEKFAKSLEATQLRSDIDQIKDDSVPDHYKKSAKQRVVTFLRKVGQTAKDKSIELGVKTLLNYLEQIGKGVF